MLIEERQATLNSDYCAEGVTTSQVLNGQQKDARSAKPRVRVFRRYNNSSQTLDRPKQKPAHEQSRESPATQTLTGGGTGTGPNSVEYECSLESRLAAK